MSQNRSMSATTNAIRHVHHKGPAEPAVEVRSSTSVTSSTTGITTCQASMINSSHLAIRGCEPPAVIIEESSKKFHRTKPDFTSNSLWIFSPPKSVWANVKYALKGYVIIACFVGTQPGGSLILTQRLTRGLCPCRPYSRFLVFRGDRTPNLHFDPVKLRWGGAWYSTQQFDDTGKNQRQKR